MERLLDAKVLAIHRALDEAGISHAFGGAIALAYWGVPRGTEDIDLNVFVPSSQARRCLAALAGLGVEEGDPRKTAPGPDQRVWHWEHTPLHVFFAYHAFHQSCARRVRRVPFADAEIPVLSAEDIAVFKTIYDRPKDRSEVREVLLCRGERFDTGYAQGWLERLLGGEDPRTEAFRDAIGS